MAARFELHGIWLSGPAYKVALLLSLAGEKFDYVHTPPRERAKTPEYMARQRYGQVPMLVDRERGLDLCQSASILEYLAGQLGRFGGANEAEALQAREWMYWEFDRLAMHVYRLRGQKLGFRSFNQPIAEMHFTEGAAALKVLNDHLASHDWLVGAGPTIADIDIYGVVSYAPAGGFTLATWPSIVAWMKRVEALEGFGAAGDLMPRG
jgi:glutathione S-transferase